MKKLIIIVGFIIFSSCNSVKDVSGLYGKCEKRHYACTQLLLNKNKTFEYYVFMDVGGVNIQKGTWEELNKNVLQLNTFEQPKNPKTYFTAKISNQNLDKINIKVKELDYPFEGMYVTLNGNNGKETNNQGNVTFDKTEIRFITYSFLGLTDTIKIDNPKYNDIEIVIRDFNSPLLTDEKIFIKKNKVKIPVGNLAYRKFELKKTNLREKQW